MARSAKTQKQSLGITGIDTSAEKLTRDASEVGIGVIAVLAAMIGIWGIACLIGAFAGEGFVEMINGYISAVTGR